MAYANGTATSFVDYYNKLRDFLTTNADLVTAGQEWSQLSGPGGVLNNTDEIVLQGPGNSGTDEIIVALKPFTSVISDYYNLAAYGMVSYNPALGNIASQIGETRPAVVHLWDAAMPYWFVANGRRFIAVIRVAGVYQMHYCGFILPYVLPTQWTYPCYIAGVSQETTGRYSNTGDLYRCPFSPGQWTARLCFPDLRWLEVWNAFSSSASVNDGSEVNFTSFARTVEPWAYDVTPVREMLGGGYSLSPAVFACGNPYTAQLGVMEGVFRVSGFSNTGENIVTVGGVDHLVIPNVYRNTWRDFGAIALE